MKFQVSILTGNSKVIAEAEPGTNLFQLLTEYGYAPASPCGGRGVCGKCKVRCGGELSPVTDEERKFFDEDMLSAGWRLSCVTKVLGDVYVNAPESARPDICADFEEPTVNGEPMFHTYGAAVDIGTTTVCVRLYDKNGFLSTAAAPNPQAVYGADVISRIGAQLAGNGAVLKSLICECIITLLIEASGKAGVPYPAIDAVVITGNTAMLCLLTNTDTEPMSHMPFTSRDYFGRYISPKELGLHAEKVYLPSCISPYVGADITCAVLACGMQNRDDAVLLADIGTNGEIVLSVNGNMTCCATAAGPALEGAGITCGSMAVPGAVDTVNAAEDHLECTTIGGKPPVGICGSGIIDAIAAFLDAEIMEDTGLLDDECEIAPYLDDEQAIVLTGSVYVSQKDVRMVQLAKSAICAGIRTLIKNRKCREEDISELLVAGGFGKHIRFESAGKIGLIPPALQEKAVAVGNAALAGASLLLRDISLTETASRIAQKCKVVELDQDPAFMDFYTSGMLFGDDDC